MTTDPSTGNLFGTHFEKILEPIEKRLQLELQSARAEFTHSGLKGAKVEARLRDCLRQFLPGGFSVGCGKAYDPFGDVSKQLDLVITNPDHPFTFPLEEDGYYLVVGISVAGEVKSVLTTGELDKAIENARALKQLRAADELSPIMMGENHRKYLQQNAGLPPYILLAFANNVAVKTLWKTVTEAPLVEPVAEKTGVGNFGTDAQPPINAICILGQGVMWNLRPDDMFTAHNPAGVPIVGWQWYETKAPLAHTLGWLHQMMLPSFRTFMLGP